MKPLQHTSLTFSRYIFLCLILLLIISPFHSGRLFGQQETNFRTTDSLTYQAYTMNDWKEVIRAAGKAIRQGTDYYYLRMRIGIAEYSLERYDRAIPHFRKAMEFSEEDPVACEYLYYALLFSGRNAEAAVFALGMPESTKKRLSIKKTGLKLFGETGIMFNSLADSLKDYRPDGTLVHTYLLTGYGYGSLGLSGQIAPRTSVNFAVQAIRFNINEQYQIAGLDPFDFDVSFTETSLYGGGQYYLGKGYTLQAGFRMLSGTYGWTAYKVRPGGADFVQNSTRYVDLATHAGISKRLPNVTLRLTADFNRFKGNLYSQVGAGVTLYPKGNLNSYLSGDISYYGPNTAWTADGNPIGKLLVGQRISPKIWLEAHLAAGNMINWSENEAYIVYNNYDPVRIRMGLNLIGVNLTEHLDLAFRYNWTRRVASWEISNGTATDVIGINYSFHSFLIGATWRF